MKERFADIDRSTNPPMQYLVARDCPKLLEGHKFYACHCYGPAVASQDKPSILVSCEFLDAEIAKGGITKVRCGYGGDKNAGNGVQFGVPTVLRADDVNDGSDPD